MLENAKVFSRRHRRRWRRRRSRRGRQSYDNTSTFSSKTAELKIDKRAFASCDSLWYNPVGIWCENDVGSTSMRRHHVASTLIRRHFCTKCPLGSPVLKLQQWYIHASLVNIHLIQNTTHFRENAHLLSCLLTLIRVKGTKTRWPLGIIQKVSLYKFGGNQLTAHEIISVLVKISHI